jgi:glycosyltransferase involved in cell wall biosynthesis
VCCVASEWAGRSLVIDDGVDPRRVRVVGLGPGAGYEPDPHAARARDWRIPRFLFVGGDWTRKNGDAVVRALTEVRRFEPCATLDIVGHHPRICSDGVTGHGPLSRARPAERAKLDDLFARATCFVMPSVLEPFGRVYVEAATVGVPSIGTSAGGAADAVGPGGLLVDPNDEAALVDAMRRMCNPSAAASFGEAARRYAELLTWDAIAQRLVRALGLNVPGTELADFL